LQRRSQNSQGLKAATSLKLKGDKTFGCGTYVSLFQRKGIRKEKLTIVVASVLLSAYTACNW